MAVYEFALDATRRVQLFQAIGEESITVLLNQTIIGSIPNQSALMMGREFPLKNGSTFIVQRVNNELHVIKDGQFLLALSAAEIAALDAKAAAAEREATQRAASILSSRESAPVIFDARKSLGWIIAGIGAIFALLAFFSMPYVSYGFLSITGQQIASAGSQYGNQFSSFQLLWIEPLIAMVLLIIASSQLYKSMSPRPIYDAQWGLVGSLGLSGITLLILLSKYLLFDTQRTYLGTNVFGTPITAPALSTLYGSGFWIYILGIAIFIVGGVVASRSA